VIFRERVESNADDMYKNKYNGIFKLKKKILIELILQTREVFIELIKQ